MIFAHVLSNQHSARKLFRLEEEVIVGMVRVAPDKSRFHKTVRFVIDEANSATKMKGAGAKEFMENDWRNVAEPQSKPI